MIDSGIKDKVGISEFSLSNHLKAGTDTTIINKIEGSVSNGRISLLLVPYGERIRIHRSE
jgi:hypothetical protein